MNCQNEISSTHPDLSQEELYWSDSSIYERTEFTPYTWPHIAIMCTHTQSLVSAVSNGSNFPYETNSGLVLKLSVRCCTIFIYNLFDEKYWPNMKLLHTHGCGKTSDLFIVPDFNWMILSPKTDSLLILSQFENRTIFDKNCGRLQT